MLSLHVLTASYRHYNYTTDVNVPLLQFHSCFISDIRVFFGVFLGPILALVLFNMVVFVLVLRVLINHCWRKVADQEKAKIAQGTFKTFISVISISFMFGLQWVFGAFTIAEASLAFQWLFVIFSTLQGFFLFLFFCVFTQDAREEWLNLLSCGRRKKEKRGAITSHASQGPRRGQKSGSTYITSGNIYSQTLRRNVLSSESSAELSSREERKATLFAMPTSISDDKDTVFVMENGANDHELNYTSDGDKVDLANGHSADLDESSKPQPVEVPEHILQRRGLFHYNPAASSPPLDMEDEKSDKDDDDDTIASVPSTTNCYSNSITDFGELTQLTELSFFTNSDVSDAEDISYL